MNEENEKSVNEITDMGGDISPDEGNGDCLLYTSPSPRDN